MSKNSKPEATDLSIHDVLPEHVETVINDFGYFANVRIQVGGFSVVLYTDSLQQARSIVAMLGIASVYDVREYASREEAQV